MFVARSGQKSNHSYYVLKGLVYVLFPKLVDNSNSCTMTPTSHTCAPSLKGRVKV